TRELGDLLRKYTKAVDSYDIRETKSEAAARAKRRESGKKDHSKGGTGKGKEKEKLSAGQQSRKFNNSTYKTHALGHYPMAIRYWGTTDGTSAQAGEHEHKRSKRVYPTTNKNDFEKQIGNRMMHKVRLKRTKDHQNDSGTRRDDHEEMPEIDPEKHHQMAKSQKRPVEIYSFINSNPYDPALVDFDRKLKTHILCRLRSLSPDTTFTNSQLHDAYIADGRIYEHQT
ncbi:hypothetical protein MPER_04972, partial [Moniliophthora perniciosa FA553]